MQQCHQDGEFGPAVIGCRGDFDFTLTFELSILSILPACLFVFIASWRSVQLYYRRPRSEGTCSGAVALYTKQVNIIILVCTKFAFFIVTAKIRTTSPKALAIASAVLDFMASIWMAPLSWLEHRRSHRPSLWLCSFLILTSLFDAVQCRTLWLLALYHDASMRAAAVSFTVSLFFKVSLLALESRQKSQPLRNIRNAKPSSPEESAGVFSLGLFWWLNSLLRLGSRRMLQLGDLYPLHSALTCTSREEETMKPDPVHQENAATSPKPGKITALVLVARGLGSQAFLPVLPRLALSGFTLAQSLLVRRILDYLSDEQQRSNTNTKYGLIGATFMVYLGIAISSSFFGYLHERALTQLRGYLIQNVYLHATRMSPKPEIDRKKVLTLVTADVEGIYNGLRNAHELWVVPIQTAFAVWLAYREVGPASVGAIGIIVISCAAVTALSPRVVARQRGWMTSMQSRISKTSDLLSSIKGLRMTGLAPAAVPLIQNARADELRRGGYFRLMIALSATVSLCPATLAPVIVFATGPRLLDATRAFTTLSYLTIMTQPLGVFIQVVPIVLGSLVNLQRIEEFLLTSCHADYRLLGPRPDEQSRIGGVDEKVGRRTANAIEIRNASFGWSVEAQPVLRDVNIEIPTSCFAIVTGPVGSGKTTLLQAIMGEVATAKGVVVVNTYRSAYCAQVPYLPRETIRANILADAPFNRERYERILAATSLVTDLEQLPMGDATKLDDRGETLSGGQKQRVALARALYQNVDLFIADDVLSGLDKETESLVFHRVFGPGGLLRRRGTTVILCTNSSMFVNMADLLINVEVDGSLTAKVNTQPPTTSTFDFSMEETCNETPIKLEKASAKASSVEYESEDPGLHPGKEKSAVLVSRGTPSGSVPEETIHKRPQVTSDSGTWLHYFSRIGWHYLLLFVFAASAFGVSTTYPTVWLEKWTRDNSFTPPQHLFAWYMGIYAFLAGSCLLFSFMVGIVVLVAFVRNSGAALHKQTLQTVMSASMQYLSQTPNGTILTLFSQDLSIIDGMLAGSLINLTSAVVITIGQAVLLVVSSAWLAISYPGLAAVFYFVRKMYVPTALRLRVLDLEAKGPIVTHVLSTLGGLTTIRAFGWTEDEIKRSHTLLDKSQQPSYLLGITQQWLLLVINLVMVVLAVVLVCLATILHLGSGVIGVGLVTLISFGRNLADGIRAYTMLEIALGAIGRVKVFGESTPCESEPKNSIVLDKDWPRNGKIEIAGVSARYDTTSNSSLALEEISMSISPRDKVAICGRTGSGKSSIVMLLLGLLKPTPECTNNITIDDVCIDHVNRNDLRDHIIAMPQDPVFLVNGTSIRQNLDQSGKASDQACQDALETVGLLSATTNLDAEFVSSTLSEGQKQLFCLARCILRQRMKIVLGGSRSDEGGIVLLDEVSAHLDEETADKVDAVIRQEFAGYTILAVTHRLRNIRYFSRAFVMDNGRIVEEGKVEDLLEAENSRLAELYEKECQ
ncbi:abc transporter [Colletotrichum incanum]|uniref:Abc transporter n=1 Tax=Colletotrichum incanum TaxID=1573173 RepID=A0A161W4C7_COLIC|nr:abc transporter [Colletotrichum incanum]OHX00935.1 ABC transporter [Colletotrichum incanum]